MSEAPPLGTLFRPEDGPGLAALEAFEGFARRLHEPAIQAACEDVERAVTALAELLGLDTSDAALALVAGCALQRREIESCQT